MKLNQFFTLFALLYFGFVFSQSNKHIKTPEPVLKINFDDSTDSKEFKAILKLKNVEIAEGKGVNGSTCIKANYVGYNQGSERMVNNIRLPKSYNVATLNYAVLFDEDFQFPRGGKLHGLAPVKRITGGKPMQKDGWSARICFKKNGGVTSYVYHQNLKGKYGEGKPSPNFYFKKGQYYQMAIYVKINTPASASNGEVIIYANGKEISSYKGLQLRAVEGKDTEINNFLFSTFHGGNSSDFAPKDNKGNYTTVSAWFDNFEVYEGLYVVSSKN